MELNSYFQAEQWKLLFRANSHDYDPQYNYRIQDLIDLNILQIENQEVFIQIHKQATREQKLKDELIHMQTWLNELHYRMAKYRPALKTTQGNALRQFRTIQSGVKNHRRISLLRSSAQDFGHFSGILAYGIVFINQSKDRILE